MSLAKAYAVPTISLYTISNTVVYALVPNKFHYQPKTRSVLYYCINTAALENGIAPPVSLADKIPASGTFPMLRVIQIFDQHTHYKAETESTQLPRYHRQISEGDSQSAHL